MYIIIKVFYTFFLVFIHLLCNFSPMIYTFTHPISTFTFSKKKKKNKANIVIHLCWFLPSFTPFIIKVKERERVDIYGVSVHVRK